MPSVIFWVPATLKWDKQYVLVRRIQKQDDGGIWVFKSLCSEGQSGQAEFRVLEIPPICLYRNGNNKSLIWHHV